MAEVSEQRALGGYARLPLNFEANQGQTDARVRFLSRGSGFTLFLTRAEAVLSLIRPSAPAADLGQAVAGRGEIDAKTVGNSAHFTRHVAPVGGVAAAQPEGVLRVRLLGSNAESVVEGSDEQPGKTNYFIGNDPRHWRTNVPTYAKVKYHNVYPGIDQVYYGNQRQLEFDFVVAPRADPKAIGLSFDGADSLQISDKGDLVLHVKGGEVRLRKPVVYQPDSISPGAAARRIIDGHYVVRGRNNVAFELAA